MSKLQEQLIQLLKQQIKNNNGSDTDSDYGNISEISFQSQDEENNIQENNSLNQQLEDNNINCVICEKQVKKYTCPACKRKTCGLECLKQHKIKYECDGIYRQEKQRLRKTQLTETEMKKDYKYLEKQIQDTETLRKKMNFVTKTPELLRFKLLKNQLYKKYHCQLQFAPAIMQRHRENMSFYYVKNKFIYINVEFKLFYIDEKSEAKFQRYLMDPVQEDQKISSIIKQSDLSNNKLLTEYKLDLTQGNIEKLIEQNKIKVYMQNLYKTNEMKRKKENNELNDNEMWFNLENVQELAMLEINTDKQLNELMYYLRIKEFPTFYLILEQYQDEFMQKYKNYQTDLNQDIQNDQNQNDLNGKQEEKQQEESTKQQQEKQNIINNNVLQAISQDLLQGIKDNDNSNQNNEDLNINDMLNDL